MKRSSGPVLRTGEFRPDSRVGDWYDSDASLDSTISPIRISHAVTLKVFYSVRGLTLQNESIEGDDQSGDMRMLVIPVSVRLPSVSHQRLHIAGQG